MFSTDRILALDVGASKILLAEFSLKGPVPVLTGYASAELDPLAAGQPGADLFSSAVARYLNLRAAGADTSSLFYGSEEEYLRAFDTVTNTWIERYDPAAEWNPAREQDDPLVLGIAVLAARTGRRTSIWPTATTPLTIHPNTASS